MILLARRERPVQKEIQAIINTRVVSITVPAPRLPDVSDATSSIGAKAPVAVAKLNSSASRTAE